MVKRHALLYFVAAPWNLLVAWPVVLLIWRLWGKDLKWEVPPYHMEEGCGPALTCQIKKGSFPVRRGRWPAGWYLYDRETEHAWGGTTLGHAIFYGPEGRVDADAVLMWSRTQAHEHVHVEQFEAAMVSSFLAAVGVGIALAALGHPLAALLVAGVLWSSGYLLMGAGGWAAAFLRGESPYSGSAHEESAYSQDKRLHRMGRGK